MEILTKPLLKVRTPRVKAIVTHKSYPYAIVCMFTGEVSLYDVKTLQFKKTLQICTVPIRTGAIVPSKDWILLGTDDGNILVLDIGNLSIIDTVKAHDDFIRKIAVDEANFRFVTVSDDNRTKLWGFKDEIVLINKYKDSKHFVMDVCFYPADRTQFLTVSLDGKIRLYSVSHVKYIKAFKGHERGINTIDFISPTIFITGADDYSVMVWDIKRALPIAVLKGHTKNVTRVIAMKNGFISCSEDSTVRFWNNDYKTFEVISLQGRIWELCYKDNKVFVGSDEELAVYQESKPNNFAVLCDNRIFYNQKDTFFSTKTDELGAVKELGSFEADFNSFSINSTGKYVGVTYDGEFIIYSILGMRKKFADAGKDLHFFDQDGMVFLKNGNIVVGRKNEISDEKAIENATKILFCDGNSILINTSKTCLYSLDFKLIHEFNICAKYGALIGKNTVLMTDNKIHFFDDNFNTIDILDFEVDQYKICDDIMYFSSNNKSFYVIVANNKISINNMKHHSCMIGVRNGLLYYSSNGIKTEKIDYQMIEFQREFMLDLDPVPDESIRDKAIAFVEGLGFYDKALSLCREDNQKFEILIKLGNLQEALRSANSPIKFEKLGKKFFNQGDMANAAECFYKANNINSLFLSDLFGNKKHFNHVANAAKKSGQLNLAFLAFYKSKDFKNCRDLLKDTPFQSAFNKFYCQSN